MTVDPLSPLPASDTAAARKARGAFFTPVGITRHLADWAIRDAGDAVLEPSAGEAAFLVAAVARLAALGAKTPEVHGVELHAHSAALARTAVTEAGGAAVIRVDDFFVTEAAGRYDAVIGNPPFIRYQDFAGRSRDRARFAALQQGVALTGLASSWAAFVVHAAAHLRAGGRLAMVLPAELLSVNYAAPVRRFLLERFASVELVTFEEQVFEGAEADTVLVKADGWGGAPAGVATLRQTRNAATLSSLGAGTTWTPGSFEDRWHPLPLRDASAEAIAAAFREGVTAPLHAYGETSLGAVTGGNRFFALSPARVASLGIPRRDLVPISPPGSAHLRGLQVTRTDLAALGRDGAATWLLRPSTRPAAATLSYLASGEATGVDQAYKCRVRSPWWRVPLLAPPDLFLTYMNADTARLTTNAAGVRHLNSVHGVYLDDTVRELAREVLPVASLNALTLLGAELTGRSYGGGILKIEPREADRWWMPAPAALAEHRDQLIAVKPRVRARLRARDLRGAAALVDDILLAPGLGADALQALRADHAEWTSRRTVRGRSGRIPEESR